MSSRFASAAARIGPVLARLAVLAAVPAAPVAAHDLCLIPELSAPAPGATLRVALHVSEVFPASRPTGDRRRRATFSCSTPGEGSTSRAGRRKASR